MHVYNEISKFNSIWGFNCEHNLRYPQITRDIMVYAGFLDAHLSTGHSRPTSSSIGPDQHHEGNMEARPDQKEMKQAINKFLPLLEKKEKNLSTWRPLRTWPPYCHTCPSLHKGQTWPPYCHTCPSLHKFVLLQLKVTVQIRGLSQWQQSQALPTSSAGTPDYQAVWGFSSFKVRLMASHLLKKCKLLSKTWIWSAY